MAAMVLGHQGGWDEILVVALPIGLFVGLLWVANLRASRLDPTGDGPSGPVDAPDPGAEETGTTDGTDGTGTGSGTDSGARAQDRASGDHDDHDPPLGDPDPRPDRDRGPWR